MDALLTIYEESPRPILIHCQGGTHRTGVASALYRLSRGERVDEIDEEFTIFYGEPEIGAWVQHYEASGKSFEQWSAEDYPAFYDSMQKK